MKSRIESSPPIPGPRFSGLVTRAAQLRGRRVVSLRIEFMRDSMSALRFHRNDAVWVKVERRAAGGDRKRPRFQQQHVATALIVLCQRVQPFAAGGQADGDDRAHRRRVRDHGGIRKIDRGERPPFHPFLVPLSEAVAMRP